MVHFMVLDAEGQVYMRAVSENEQVFQNVFSGSVRDLRGLQADPWSMFKVSQKINSRKDRWGTQA